MGGQSYPMAKVTPISGQSYPKITFFRIQADFLENSAYTMDSCAQISKNETFIYQ